MACDEHPKKMTVAQAVNPSTDVPSEVRIILRQHSTLEISFSRGGVLAHCRGFGTCGWKDAGTRRLGARLVGVARAWHGPTLNASGGTALLCLSLSHLCWHEDSSRVGEWPDSDTR